LVSKHLYDSAASILQFDVSLDADVGCEAINDDTDSVVVDAYTTSSSLEVMIICGWDQ